MLLTVQSQREGRDLDVSGTRFRDKETSSNTPTIVMSYKRLASYLFVSCKSRFMSIVQLTIDTEAIENRFYVGDTSSTLQSLTLLKRQRR